jgi:hypothetical protein
VGNLSSAEVFQPKHALIIQNKDELKIPLMMETIPAPQEFRDAIESLSPEQQAFCKAYRKMQARGWEPSNVLRAQRRQLSSSRLL